jgi:hypothetical protein
VGTPYVWVGPTQLTIKTLNIFYMKKIIKISATVLSLYLISWVLLWVLAYACGAPANVDQWNENARIIVALIGAPLVAFILVMISDSTVN